ncbi:hypothetical protein Tco_0217887 [Tanacetum coccineum]
MWYLFDPTPSGWCKMDDHSTDYGPRIQINTSRISLKLWTHLTLTVKTGKERACVYFNFPYAIKQSIGLNAFQQDPSPHGRILLPDSLLNSFHRRTINQSAGGKLHDLNPEESWAILEDLALYDNESWNDPRDFAKPVKAIALPQDVPSTSDRSLIEFENQVQCLMEAHLDPTQPTQVNKITTPCEICSGPHDTQFCMENLEQAFVEYASSHTNEAGEGLVSEFMASQDARLSKFEADFKQQQSEMTNKINTVLKAIIDRIDDDEVMFIKIIRDDEPQNEDPHEIEGACLLRLSRRMTIPARRNLNQERKK